MLGTYLNAATPDCTAGTLSVTPHNTISYTPARMQKVITFDGPQESRISIDDDYSFMIDVQWELLPASNSGQVIDFLLGWDKANGIVRSFKWYHPTDGYTYVVRATKLPSIVHQPPDFYNISTSFKILGVIAAQRALREQSGAWITLGLGGAENLYFIEYYDTT